MGLGSRAAHHEFLLGLWSWPGYFGRAVGFVWGGGLWGRGGSVGVLGARGGTAL